MKQPQENLRLLDEEYAISETSALARETLKLFYSAKRLFRLLASKNEVHDQRHIRGQANQSSTVACSPST